MAVHLDHILIPAKNRDSEARKLAEILGLSWGPARVGLFNWSEPDGHVWELLTESYAR